jgi:hypothetical protein
MATLNSWSEKEKKLASEDWQGKVDGLKCKPHTHTDPKDHNVITLEIHHNPLTQLYNMEGNQ